MRPGVLITLVAGAVLCMSQPAFGQAKKLLLANSTENDSVLSVELPDQITHFVIRAGSSYTASLRATKDDRVIIARQAGSAGSLFASPCKVFACNFFDAAAATAETLEAYLLGDDTTSYASGSPFVARLSVKISEQGDALASLLRTRHDFGNLAVVVEVPLNTASRRHP